MDRRALLAKCSVCHVRPGCNVFECCTSGHADECEHLKNWQQLVDYIENLELENERLKRANYGLTTQVNNLKEKEEKRYRYEGWND